MRRLSLPEPRYLSTLIDGHARVVGALRLRDADQADRSLRSHLGHTPSGLRGIRGCNSDTSEQEAVSR